MPTAPHHVVILGGYGNFGRVIVERIAAIPGVGVTLAGRDGARAQACAATLGVRAARLDANDAALAARLRALGATCVISTVGPFQGQDYRVARAALDANAHYVDIADARTFVTGIVALDAAARAADRLVLSGASSVPTLAAAVIDRERTAFQSLDTIEYGICVSERTPGLATIEAALEYCGRPMRVWQEGHWRVAYGWQDLRRRRFRVLPDARWFANCDVPDLDLFPARYAPVRSVRFRAGLSFAPRPLGLWLLSWLVRAIPRADPVRLAPPLHRVSRWFERFGHGTSGMYVELAGRDGAGQPLRRTWELVARRNHGIAIPCLGAVAIVRKLAAGTLAVRGAMPCVGIVTLDDYLAELQGLDIAWDAWG